MADNYEAVGSREDELLAKVMEDECYQFIKENNIVITMFFKNGKYDKDGNLKTPALQKNGKPIPGVLKIVSNFNRITDNTDVKIVLNREVWDDMIEEERKAVLEHLLMFIEVKKDKDGDPVMISEESEKVVLKMRKPDYLIEGWEKLVDLYHGHYYQAEEAEKFLK